MLTTLYLVLSLLSTVPAEERQALVMDAAIVDGVCVEGVAADGSVVCDDSIKAIWSQVASEGVEVAACDPRDDVVDCWNMADSDPIAGI